MTWGELLFCHVLARIRFKKSTSNCHVHCGAFLVGIVVCPIKHIKELPGSLCVCIVFLLTRIGSINHQARKQVLAKESEAEVVLARYNHDSVRKLLAEVGIMTLAS